MMDGIQSHDAAMWHAHTQVRKYSEDIDLWLADGRTQVEFEETFDPFAIVDIDGNLLLNSGIGVMEDLLIGVAGTVFSNANARLGVGDSTTAAAASQTDLQAAANKVRVAMDATYPSRAGTVLTFQSSFGSAVANWVWNEWGIFNAAAAGSMLNRKVEALGTKATGTWVLQVTITIS
jgi:hypothetical protein